MNLFIQGAAIIILMVIAVVAYWTGENRSNWRLFIISVSITLSALIPFSPLDNLLTS